MHFKLVLKSSLFTILLPGIGIILIPYLIINGFGLLIWPHISFINIIVSVLGLFCLGFLLQCIWGFVVYGKGTLVPIDPPKHLVLCGLYKYTRNPMYIAVIGVLLSEVILFKSLHLLLYLIIGIVVLHLFVVFYEEPKLRAQFGEDYQKYCKSVPRWMITSSPYKDD